MKKRRRVLLASALPALALGGYFWVFVLPEQRLAALKSELHSLGVPKSFEEVPQRSRREGTNGAAAYEAVFAQWMDMDRGRLSSALKLDAASSAFEFKEARQAANELEPVLKSFETALGHDHALFEKPWNALYYEITFPELTHFRSFGDIYVGLGHLSLHEGDPDGVLHSIRCLDKAARHVSDMPFLIRNIISARLRRQASALVEEAAARWKDDPHSLQELQAFLNAREEPEDISSALRVDVLWQIDQLEFPEQQLPELDFGPKDGRAKSAYRFLALSSSNRRGTQIKIAEVWRTTLTAGTEEQILEVYKQHRAELSRDNSISGRLANQMLLDVAPIIYVRKSEREEHRRALAAVKSALEALKSAEPAGQTPR